MNLSTRFNLSRACAILGYSRQAYYKPVVGKANMESSCLEALYSQANTARKGCPTRGCRAMYEKFGSTLSIGRDKAIELLMENGYRVRYLEGERKFYTIYITDVYSQEIVGYGAFDSNRATNYTQVLKQAIVRCSRHTNGLKGLIHHSDGGKQYESREYKKLCLRHGILQSMCMYSYENPYAEKTNDLINNGYLNVWRPRTLGQLRKYQKRAVKDHNENSRKRVLGRL